MKFGFSSYSFHQRLRTGAMSLFDVIDWVADSEGEHLELASITPGADSPVPNTDSDPAFVDKVAEHAAQRGVALSNLAIGASFLGDDAEVGAEVERVKAHVDLAERLGIRLMRHDVVRHAGIDGDDTPAFEAALPTIVRASKEIAQYAATKGITTSLENHGFFVQASDRVRRIVHDSVQGIRVALAFVEQL
jgi:3-oxoisoapionate decarboxylase